MFMTNRLYALVPLALFAALSGWIQWRVWQTVGRTMYPIDDPFIHLAMAKHLSQDGVYGVSLAGFSASSSSPAWTILMAALFAIGGVHAWWPLAVNLAASAALIAFLFRAHERYAGSPAFAAAWASLIVLLLPLATMASVGMEHPLHILALLALAVRFAEAWLRGEPDGFDVRLFGLAALAVMLRYETVFVAAPLCALAAARGRWRQTAALAAGALLPVAAIGTVNLIQGWNFFPSSIFLKSALNNPDTHPAAAVAVRLHGQLFSTPHLLVLWMIVSARLAWLFARREAFSRLDGLLCFVMSGAAVLHCALANIGWFYRYEGYLLALGLLALGAGGREAIGAAKAWWESLPRLGETLAARGMAVLLAVLFFFPFADNVFSFRKVAGGAKNVYEQHWQMGLFLREYYNGETVVANDIGAINYLADIVCLDLVGLGSVQPVRASAVRQFSPAFVESWARVSDARIAMIYENWWRRALPPSWIKVGEWTLPEKTTAGDPTVSFFAVNEDEVEPLRAALMAFEPQLPGGVDCRILGL